MEVQTTRYVQQVYCLLCIQKLPGTIYYRPVLSGFIPAEPSANRTFIQTVEIDCNCYFDLCKK